jgi:hypothetical protein
MGKLLNSLLLIAAIELSMALFLGISTPVTSLLTLVLNPSTWSSTSIITKFMSLTTAASLGVIAIGTLLYKSDFFIYGAIAALFLSYGLVFANLYSYLNSVPGLQNTPLVIIILAPMIITYIYTILKFWRGWD